jgi:hypothetical protein
MDEKLRPPLFHLYKRGDGVAVVHYTNRQLYIHDYNRHRKSDAKPAKKQRISLLDDGEQIGWPYDFSSASKVVKHSALQ